MQIIYLDNNASTAMLPEVWEAMGPYGMGIYGNPASAHLSGRRARQALEDAREQVADMLGASPDEVIFTSGATEANNLAILGLAGDLPEHIITSPIEHPSVAEPVGQLAKLGYPVDFLPVDRTGIVRHEALPDLLRPDTRLISVMLANNETGAIQPARELRSLLSNAQSVAFHCDAVQAVGKIPVHFHDLGVTSLSVSAHKFHGPKGIGVLILKRNARLRPRVLGGHQQQGRRPGTEPVGLAVGLAKALELCHKQMRQRTDHVAGLRSIFLDRLKASAEPIVLNGPSAEGHVLPHTLNISFPGCRADSLLMNLDLAGVACSTGSACSSGSLLPSPVLQAMGVAEEVLHSAIRFSLSHLLTEQDAIEAARRIAESVNRLRRIRE